MAPLGPDSWPPRAAKRPRWVARAAVGGGVAIFVAIVVAIGLTALSGSAAPAAQSGQASASKPPPPPESFPPLPPPPPGLTADQLEKVLITAQTLPHGYDVNGGVQTLTGYGQDPPPTTLSCSAVAQFLGSLSYYDLNYANDANLVADDGAGDMMHIDLFEAVSVAAAVSDVAALRAGGAACRPVLDTGLTGSFYLTVTSVPGLGSENVLLHLTQVGNGPIGSPFGQRDILLVRDGSYLVDVDDALSAPAGTRPNPSRPKSVLPPGATIADSVLSGL